MKGENRNYPRVAEAKPVDPEMRQEGLRLLARMIAQKYIRSRDPKDRLDQEPNREILSRTLAINVDMEVSRPKNRLNGAMGIS